MVVLTAPRQQESLPPVVLPEPIDSSVFLAKEYRPRPLAFLQPFGVHVLRLSTPRSEVPTSVRGVHVRGAVEEARLPFDSYATQLKPRRAEPGLQLTRLSLASTQTKTLTSAGCRESSAGDGRALRRVEPRRGAGSRLAPGGGSGAGRQRGGSRGALARGSAAPPPNPNPNPNPNHSPRPSPSPRPNPNPSPIPNLIFDQVEQQLVRQACAECVERGELMEAVRRRREAQAGLMRRQVLEQRAPHPSSARAGARTP